MYIITATAEKPIATTSLKTAAKAIYDILNDWEADYYTVGGITHRLTTDPIEGEDYSIWMVGKLVLRCYYDIEIEG